MPSQKASAPTDSAPPLTAQVLSSIASTGPTAAGSRSAITAAGACTITRDLAGVEYCDLAGLRAIIRLAGSAGSHDHEGTRLVLHEVPGYLVAVLQILGWDTTPGLTIEKPGERPAGQASPMSGISLLE